MTAEEPPIEPDRPIIDPHLHLWEILPAPGSPQLPQTFLLPQLLQMLEASGHNVTHTVFVECHQMYRQDGPEELRPVGETEFANGAAAMAASGKYGPCLVAHRIVSSANLLLGDGVRPVLEAHASRAGERFRGIRMALAYSEADMFGFPCDPSLKGIMLDPRFHEGARALADMDLSLDVWCLHTQLGELASLADALPGLTIILDHVGTPESQGVWAGREAEARAEWAPRIAELARRPNVLVKLGGLGMDIGAQVGANNVLSPSEALAERWRPCIETCIEAFTPARAMFESNFPPDNAAGSYGATWNAFKRIAANCSDQEKDQLFRRTAARSYRIALD
ncbi:MAG: amidohydrolase family protein [Novosphingobium sp.]|nr:amidohydrolase family protein [Novosphingobium sp.]